MSATALDKEDGLSPQRHYRGEGMLACSWWARRQHVPFRRLRQTWGESQGPYEFTLFARSAPPAPIPWWLMACAATCSAHRFRQELAADQAALERSAGVRPGQWQPAQGRHPGHRRSWRQRADQQRTPGVPSPSSTVPTAPRWPTPPPMRRAAWSWWARVAYPRATPTGVRAGQKQ